MQSESYQGQVPSTVSEQKLSECEQELADGRSERWHL